MSLINVREKTIQAKIVYYGTALCGKTTSLKQVHKVIDPEGRVELVSLNTEGDRTFFFDFLPIPLGTVHGYQVKLQAFTVPGQVKYNLTRRYVLRGADAVIFVADSQPSAFEDNVRSMLSLTENLIANGLDADRIPILLQYNKRDAPDAAPIEALRAALNGRGLPEFETIATDGTGVFEAFTGICGAVTASLAREYRVGDAEDARQAVERRLRATLLTQRRSATAAPAASEPATGSGATAAALVPEEKDQTTSVIQVSSADVPDIPDAETLLKHAVDTNIESARLLSELTETKRRLADNVNQLAALHQTGVLLASELDVDRLLSRILASSLRTVDAQHGSVLLFDESGSLKPRLTHGFLADPIAGAPGGDPTTEGRIQLGKPFILDLDPAPEEVPLHGESQCPMIGLVAPVVHHGEVLGALTAYVLDRPLDQDLKQRLRFLNAVASQASVALVNARLVGRIESFNRELELKVAERTSELAAALEELTELDRLKDDFLASMSHELLTPLQSIGSAGEILVSLADDPRPDAASERREFACVVQRESVRLTGMLKAVLDLSQLEAGEIEFRKASVNLRDAALASYHRLRPEFKLTQAKLKIRVEEGMPAASADPAWLGRVIDAVLSNAVKFAPAAMDVHLTIRRDGDMACVEVRDHGPGIPEAQCASVFEKFKQTGDVLTEKPSGLGLGLPTARLLVERMGGRIWYEPAQGGGSVFAFTVPLSASAVPSSTDA